MPPVSQQAPDKEPSLFESTAVTEQSPIDISNATDPINFEITDPILENNVEGGKDKKKIISKKILIKIGAGVAAIALLTGGFFAGTKLNNNGDKKSGETGLGADEPTEASTPGESSESQAATISTESANESIVIIDSNETSDQTNSSETSVSNPEIFSNIEYLPQTKTLEEMKAIDNIEDWAKLSPVDRAAYFIMTNTVYFTGYSADTLNDYTKEHSFSECMSVFVLGEICDTTRGAFLADGIEAAKLASAEYYNTIAADGDLSPAYKDLSEWAMSDKADQTMVNYDTTMVFESAGVPNQTTHDSLGNEIKYTNITYAYKSMSTGEIGTLRTVAVAVVPIELMDGNKVVCFMRYVGIDGKESPIENMPY